MRKLFLFLLIAISTLNCYANQHSFSTFINYSLKQTKQPGYGIHYQYPFNETLAVEFAFIDNKNITVEQDKANISGAFSSTLFGVNIKRDYNEFVSIKLGSGFSYVSSSTNNILIKNNQVSPYLKFSTNVTLSEQFSLELGQLSQFSSEALGTNHSIFLSLNYQFSKQKASNLNSSSNQPIPLFKEPSKKEINIVSTAETTTISVKSKNSGWVVQLGAFSKKENALAKLKEIQMQFSTNTYQLIYYKKLFRVISKKFKEKAGIAETSNFY